MTQNNYQEQIQSIHAQHAEAMLQVARRVDQINYWYEQQKRVHALEYREIVQNYNDYNSLYFDSLALFQNSLRS